MDWQKNEETKAYEIISYFKKTIQSNIRKESIFKMFSTYISFNSKISGVSKTYRYIIFYPFQLINEFGINDGIVPYSSMFNNQSIYMKDFCYSVDKSFYEWLYDEMRTIKNVVVAEINDDEVSWKVSKDKLLIYSDNFSISGSIIEEYFNQTFEKWYENAIFKANFNIKIINPMLYSVPFPLNTIVFNFGPKNYGSGNKLTYVKT